MQSCDRPFLFEILTNDGILITPNNRLSQYLLMDFFTQQKKEVQAKPQCYPYPLFLQKLYKKLHHLYPKISHPILLNAHQELFLLEKCIQQNGSFNTGLITEIQNAWHQCQNWLVNLNDNNQFLEKYTTEQFQDWILQFELTLKNTNLISSCQLGQYMMQFPELLPNQKIAWVCFDDFTPLQKLLQENLTTNGSEQFIFDIPERLSSIHKFAAKDTDEEYQQMIKWSKAKLAEGANKIGLVIPDLESKASYLNRLFTKNFTKDEFNISYGKPLIEYTVIAHALAFLRLQPGQLLNNPDVRLLLQSPYLSYSENEFMARTEFLQNSKIMKQRTVNYKIFTAHLTKYAPNLTNILNTISDYPQKAEIKLWRNLFLQRLTQLGFPGENSINSFTYQCVQRFINLLDEWLQMAVVTPILTFNEALTSINSWCIKTIFQPQNENTPIQILGLLEASGCNFDYIWMNGLTDQCLPEKTKFSAFIPLDMQRTLHMPYTSPAQEGKLAKKRLERLKNSCKEIVVSYPLVTEDTPNLPTPFIKNYPAYSIIDSGKTDLISQLLTTDEVYQIPLLDTEAITGGTSLLAYQAQCPFKAFAAHRLHARPAPITNDGLDPIERGHLIHKTMELIWQKLNNQQNLLNYSEQQLDILLQQTCEQVLLTFSLQELSPVQHEIESTRLQRLVKASLIWEKQRPPFIIDCLEKEYIFPIAGIDIKVRIDRMDKIGSEKWVIDYKTSLPNKPWKEQRPDAPQLLLYALLDEEIQAILYLELNKGQVKCSGLSANDNGVSGINTISESEEWSEYQNKWQEQLTTLVEEFKSGECPPKPSKASICEQCDFIELCRV